VRAGVVVWAEGTTVRFRIAGGFRAERGMLLKVEDRGRRFILRVYDFRPESLLSQAEVAMLSSRAQRGERVELYEKELRLYDTALATIVAQVDEDGAAHGPTSVPPLFAPVETLERGDLDALKLDTGDLPLGVVRVGHRPGDVEVSLDGARVIPHHVLVAGSTGAGKSNLGRVLAASVLHSGRYSIVVFDCESEYLTGGGPGSMGLAHLPYSEERLFLVSNRASRPGRLRVRVSVDGVAVERSILAHPLKMSLTRLKPWDFAMTGEFTGPQEELLWMAYKTFGDEWVSTLLGMDGRGLYQRLGRMSSVNTINVTRRKLRRLVGDGEVFCEDCDYDLAGAVLSMAAKGRVIVVETPFASEGEEKLLATVIAGRLFRAYEKMRKELPEKWGELPPVLVMVEEAHRYLSKTALSSPGEVRENIFSIIAKRGRKYKVGGLYITQMPGELMETIIRQALTKIVLPLPTRPDYEKVIGYSPYLDEAEQEIKTLDRGEALVVSPPSGLRFAVPIKVYRFEDYARRLIALEEEAVVRASASGG